MVIDLTPVRDKTRPSRLLAMVEGPLQQAVKTWLAGRPKAWRDGLEVVAMDGFTGFKTATTEELPEAVAVIDPFHVVRLAGDALDRRAPSTSVTGGTGHRGRASRGRSPASSGGTRGRRMSKEHTVSMETGGRTNASEPEAEPYLVERPGSGDDEPVVPPLSRRSLLAAVVGAGGITAIGGSAWLVGGTDGYTSTSPRRDAADAVSTGQPVTEYPPTDRGEPVELSGVTLTDDQLDLADLRGEVVVVNVWGSWCGPCRVEGPVLAKLSTEYLDREVSFVGVDVKDNRAAAVAFEAGFGITYPSIEDVDGRAVLALSQYVPSSAVPVTLVLDRAGRVAARVLGAVREATLRALLDSALAEQA